MIEFETKHVYSPPDRPGRRTAYDLAGFGRRHIPCTILDNAAVRLIRQRRPKGDLKSRSRRLVFDYADWQLMTGPLVYIWTDRVLGVLYVGMSAGGLSRILRIDHHALRRADVPEMLQPRRGMRLHVWPCVDVATAVALERKFILKYRPLMNKTGRTPTKLAGATRDRSQAELRQSLPSEPPLAAARRRLEAMRRP